MKTYPLLDIISHGYCDVQLLQNHIYAFMHVYELTFGGMNAVILDGEGGEGEHILMAGLSHELYNSYTIMASLSSRVVLWSREWKYTQYKKFYADPNLVGLNFMLSLYSLI